MFISGWLFLSQVQQGGVAIVVISVKSRLLHIMIILNSLRQFVNFLHVAMDIATCMDISIDAVSGPLSVLVSAFQS